MTCFSPNFGTSPEVADALIQAEVEWEVQGIERGMTRVRNDIASAEEKVRRGAGGLVDMDVGALMLREIIKRMVPEIYRLQQEAAQNIADSKRRARWWLPLMSLEAEKWAVIVVRSVLSGMSVELKSSRPATSLCMTIGKYGKLQREFDLWKKAEAKKAKEAKAEGEDYVDLYKLMVSRVKKVDAKTAKKWMKLADDFDRLEWGKEEYLAVGMVLLDVLVRHGGGWFEMGLVGTGNGRMRTTERQLLLSDKAKEFITRRNKALELQRPWLMPMICPPKPWRYVSEAAQSDGEGYTLSKVPPSYREGSQEVHPQGEAVD